MLLRRFEIAHTLWLSRVLLIAVAAAVPHAHAATHVWTNGDIGSVGWDAAFNWQGLSRPPLVPAFVGDNSRVLMQHPPDSFGDDRSYINQEYAITRLTFVDGFEGIDLQFAALTILGAEGDIISESDELNRFANAAVHFESQPVAGGSEFSIQTDDGDLDFIAPLTISANSTLDVTVSQPDADVRLFGGLSRTGSGTVQLNKHGLGQLQVRSDVSDITDVDISAGEVVLSTGTALGNAMNIHVGGDGEFDLNNLDANIDQLTGTGDLDLGTGTLTFGERVDIVASQTFDGVIRGTGGIIKNNTGEAVLAGVNTYTGDTVVADGTLRLGASHRISNSSDLVVQAGATFDMDMFSESVRSLSGAGGTVIIPENRFFRTTSNAGETFTWGGVLTGGGTFRQDGNHTLVVNSVQANEGPTEILRGTLQLAGGGDLSNTSDVEVATGATWDLSGLNDLVSSISGGGDIRLGGAELSLGRASGISQFTGKISESGSLKKDGGHTLILSGSNSYNGNTTISGGKLQITASGNLGNGDLVFAGGELVTSASLNNAQTITMNNNDDALLTVEAGTTLTQSGDIIGSGNSDIVVDGGGTLRVTSAFGSTFSGDIRIVDGTFDKAGSGDEIGPNTVVDVGPQGTFVVNNDTEGIGNLAGSGSVILNKNLGVGQNNSLSTFAGVVSGESSFDKLGTGTLTLTGNNLYTGSTDIEAGELRLSGDGQISDSSRVFVNSGATFRMNDVDDTVKELTGGGTVELASSTLSVGTANGSANFSGTIIGTGSFSAVSTGRQTLSGTSNLTGDVLLHDTSRLTVSGGGSITNDGGVTVNDSAELVVTGAGSSINLTGDLDLNDTGGLTISDGATVDVTSESGSVNLGSTNGGNAYLMLDNGTIDSGLFSMQIEGGSLTGHGQVDGLVVNRDRVAPGITEAGSAAVGILEISGNFQQVQGGELRIEIGGVDNSDPENPQFDTLDISGTANLGGLLGVSLLGYTPRLGDTFSILSASARFNEFSNVADGERLVGVDGGTGSFLVEYTSTGVNLSDYRLFSPTADFDDDGDVDADDLAQWQDDFGGPGSDANGDGQSDGQDFLAWQRQLGLNGNSLGTLQAVPEPSSALLLIGLTLLGIIFRLH